jgi:hypothetical protein
MAGVEEETNNVVVGREKVLRSVSGVSEDRDVALRPPASTQEVFLHKVDVVLRLDQGVRGASPWRICIGDAHQQRSLPGRSRCESSLLRKNVRPATGRILGLTGCFRGSS